jgi:hypothetical protein
MGWVTLGLHRDRNADNLKIYVHKKRRDCFIIELLSSCEKPL